MQKDINTMVMENVFGKIEVEKKVIDENERKNGFYVDSFYITGMTLNQYHSWIRKKAIHYGDHLFLQ